MLQIHNRKTYRRLKKGLLVCALTLTMSGASILCAGNASYTYAQTKGVWSENTDPDSSDQYLYTDANGWVFSMDSKTAETCLLLSVPADIGSELIIPSKMRLDSVVRTVELSYYFKIPGGITRICLPKNSDYSPYWFNFDEETKNQITVCYYEGDDISDYLDDTGYKTEILDPAGSEVIGGEEADNWTFDTTKEKFIYTDENGLSYLLDDKDSNVCDLLSISGDAQGEITISSKVTIDGISRTLERINYDGCKIPAGITKVTFMESSFYIAETIFEQCSPNLVVAFPLADSYGKSSEYSGDIYRYAKGKGLQMEFLNGITDKNGVIYYIDDSSKGKLSAGVFGYTGNTADITVSSKVTINGTSYSVTKIAGWAFENNNKLKKVTLPNSISIISGYAFCNCTSLTTINLPSKLVDFNGSGVFQRCTSLTSIKIPSGVKYLPTELFEGCKKLKKVELPKKISIGDMVFSGCNALTTITNFDKVADIGSETFNGCKKLPSSLTFSNITGIGSGAFYGCTSLKSVTINSKSIRYLGDSAFQGAKNLKNITIKATNLSAKNMGANIFKGTHKKLVIKVPAKKVSAYKKLFKKYGNKTITVKKI
ncbi:MAG: leucine-rich repeat domain-containing protein [Lachnospiraceae bacterium]|nr:leucine-rich repeat domain-containing protein [Lachnospiraceae bacterium]